MADSSHEQPSLHIASRGRARVSRLRVNLSDRVHVFLSVSVCLSSVMGIFIHIWIFAFLF